MKKLHLSLLGKEKIGGLLLPPDNLKRSLFYLTIFLLPIQLSYHLFFDFAKIAGIVSDYLLPTVYLTDILVVFLFMVEIYSKRKNFLGKVTFPVVLFFVYLLFSSLYISPNKWAAIYKLIKIGEFALLLKIGINLKPNYLATIGFLCGGVIYSSLIAIGQFIMQRSIGGLFWFLGERNFYVTTPTIAATTLGGQLVLRPYATFAHPNVLGGFLSIILPVIFGQLVKNKTLNRRVKIFFTGGFLLGLITLILTFSRASWLVFMVGLGLTLSFGGRKINEFLVRRKHMFLYVFLFLFLWSIMIPIGATLKQNTRRGSMFERSSLIYASLINIYRDPLFGSGLNNSIMEQYKLLPKRYGLYILQPVHNIYLLTLAELGFLGFFFLLYFLTRLFNQLTVRNIGKFLPLVLLLFLGFFDHYLLTLQQGQLLLVTVLILVLTSG